MNRLIWGTKKITGVADGTNDNDAINKLQFENHIKYYYYTDDLKHQNYNNVLFPDGINKYPFLTHISDGKSRVIKLLLSGYYHIIYTDYYKKAGNVSGYFTVKYDEPISNKPSDPIFKLDLIHEIDWTPLTINVIKKIEIKPSSSNSSIILTSNVLLYGKGYSTFYIKFLHA